MGSIKGIPIYFHFTFLIIIPIFAAFFAFTGVKIDGIIFGFSFLDVSLPAKLVLGAICAITFFLTILLHEIGHSFIALRHGYRIKSITLFLFGGVAHLEETPRDPRVEGTMAFAGPATSFAIGFVLIAIALLLNDLPRGNVPIQALRIMCGTIGFYNLLLGGFNLIPAFPMDGGRILRSILASQVGMLRATDMAVKIGKGIAVAMIVIGIVFFDIFIVLVALFIYTGASEEAQMTKLMLALEGVKVHTIMNPNVYWLEPSMSVDEALKKMIVERRLTYPVVENGVLLGIITSQAVASVPLNERSNVKVAQIVNPSMPYVRDYMDASEILKIMSPQNDFVVVLDSRDEFVGSISRDEFKRIVSLLAVQKGIPLN
ncbi:MAG: site-2 protease family protein [Methanomassiliicoccales archaeon]|jgi:Zn-dependent protease|nr:site-2 protease family protein [Methanomassiliicoccales archaeon]